MQHRDLLTPGHARDLACGRGRHTLYLAQEGFRVEAWDRDAAALEEVQTTAKTLGLSTITTRLADLQHEPPIPPAPFDVMAVYYSLHRHLFTQIRRPLKPGG